jgi:hypothetical protein
LKQKNYVHKNRQIKTLPLRKLYERSNTIKRVKLDIEFGMVPEHSHPTISSEVNFLSSPTSEGIDPENSEEVIAKLSKLLRLPIQIALVLKTHNQRFTILSTY